MSSCLRINNAGVNRQTAKIRRTIRLVKAGSISALNTAEMGYTMPTLLGGFSARVSPSVMLRFQKAQNALREAANAANAARTINIA